MTSRRTSRPRRQSSPKKKDKSNKDEVENVVVVIRSIGIVVNRELFNATLDGLLIRSASNNPEHEAARALLRMGHSGTVQFRRAGRALPYSLPQCIASLAKITVRESDRRGPEFMEYRPFAYKPPPRPRKARSGSPKRRSQKASRFERKGTSSKAEAPALVKRVQQDAARLRKSEEAVMKN